MSMCKFMSVLVAGAILLASAVEGGSEELTSTAVRDRDVNLYVVWRVVVDRVRDRDVNLYVVRDVDRVRMRDRDVNLYVVWRVVVDRVRYRDVNLYVVWRVVVDRVRDRDVNLYVVRDVDRVWMRDRDVNLTSSSGASLPICICGNYEIPTFDYVGPKVVPFSKAADVCRDVYTVGVAAAGTGNLNTLGALITSCNVTGAWVKSWNGDTYNNSALYVTRNATGPGFAVEVDITGNLTFPVICQIAY
ncbi:unnamed protein product (mitochondrion) [Plasmodiophora brassicae]|uniref:Uncharacterized protein n=1 Tax=Plasmodiophora brassicae TaxID=37360 RepID=A0A3P3YDW4_PLABS|nr:unnamed protein product [Plasmodiophora brassicae]